MRKGLIAAAVVLAIVAIGIWGNVRARRAVDAELARRQERIEQLEQKDRAHQALIPALEARDRDLVERLVAAQQRERVLTDQLAIARQASTVAADRAKALEKAPLAELLREGERLGIRARAR